MKLKRITLCALFAAAGVVATYIFANRDPDAPRADWPILQAAIISSQHAPVTVHPNVLVSPPEDDGQYWECVIAADPVNASRLCAAAMRHTGRPSGAAIVCFHSRDQGQTWEVGCRQKPEAGHGFCDPTVAFGADGSSYLAYMDVDQKTLRSPNPSVLVALYASRDGGATWEKPVKISRFVDRPWLTVDTVAANRDGHIYCLGQIEHRTPDGEVTHAEPILYRSKDKLRTISDGATPHKGRTMINCRPANPLVLSDGTLVIAYQDRYLRRKIKQWPRPVIYVMKSTDQGKTFADLPPVNTRWFHETITSSPDSMEGLDFLQLAVGSASDRFMDRLYCVWADGSCDANATRIFFSYSSDRGETWTTPVVVSEQPMQHGVEGEYLTFIPAIAVNRFGVVAVSWYDRRGLSKPRRARIDGDDVPAGAFETVAAGWNYRVRMSLDGGDTWMPSVQVNESSGVGDVSVGHTAGIAADAAGVFHATWVDNRNGRNELWTAAIEINDHSDNDRD